MKLDKFYKLKPGDTIKVFDKKAKVIEKPEDGTVKVKIKEMIHIVYNDEIE